MSHLHIKPLEVTWGDHWIDDNRRLERFLGRGRVPNCAPRDKTVGWRGDGFGGSREEGS